ncbi:MAG: hypothetical protein AB7O65_09605 [Candidatus Korobacteraceae bacterium]
MSLRSYIRNLHPHRFRDTFAVDMLARGASIYDVAKLLGDTIETVEQHYAEFVNVLQERVRQLMEIRDGGLEAFRETVNDEPRAKARAKTAAM